MAPTALPFRITREEFSIPRQIFSCDLRRLRDIVAGHRYVLLDEAQHIPDVGRALKIIHDNRIPGEFDPRILVTASSRLSHLRAARERLFPGARFQSVDMDNWLEFVLG